MRKLDPSNPIAFAATMLFAIVACLVADVSAPIAVAVVFCVGAALLFAGNLDVDTRDDRNRT